MNNNFFSKNKNDYIEFLQAVGIIFILYVILKKFGIFDLDFSFSDKPKLPVVLLIGLTAGISTCMALVGGLVLGISARFSEKHPKMSGRQKFKPHVFFNLGRVLGFAILGGLIGILGDIISFSINTYAVLILIVSVVMFVLGLKLIEIMPGLNKISVTLPSALSRKFKLHQAGQHYSNKGAALAGALSFFLPCGFTQAMQIYAVSTGSFISGALIMGIFAIGTSPGLLGIGGLSSAFQKGEWKNIFFKFAGIVVIIFAIINLQGGLNLLGFQMPNIKLEKGKSEQIKIVDGKQIVRIEQYAGGYYPNQITVKKEIPVKLIVDSTNTYTCASRFTIPKMGIYKDLKIGENEIEFTPLKAGPLSFMCSMGMFGGIINVVN